MIKQMIQNELKNFNWKKYAVRVLITWCVMSFTLGIVSELGVAAKHESIWIYAGSNKVQNFLDHDLELKFYILRHSLVVSPEGNPVITMRIVYGDLGETVSEVEFDCDKGLFRSNKTGRTMDEMVKKTSPFWVKSPEGSAGNLILMRTCFAFKNN